MSTKNSTPNGAPLCLVNSTDVHGASPASDQQQNLDLGGTPCDGADYQASVPEQSHNGGGALAHSNEKHQGEYAEAARRGGSHYEKRFATPAIDPVSQTSSPTHQHLITLHPQYLWLTSALFRYTFGFFGNTVESEKPVDGEMLQITTKFNSLKKENEELKTVCSDMKYKLGREQHRLLYVIEQRDAMLQAKDNVLKKAETDLQKIREEARTLAQNVQYWRANTHHYEAIADRLDKQLLCLEQSNSKAPGTTGAHKDSPAVPPNLKKSVFVVAEKAFECSKAFLDFFKKPLENHEVFQNPPEWADKRFRKFEVEAYICSHMFAGFENDSYHDSFECTQGSERYLLANHKDTEFFMKNQDLEIRHQRYLEEYYSLQKFGLKGIMRDLKNIVASTNPFHLFCYRKLHNIITSLNVSCEEFGPFQESDGDYSKNLLFCHLATNPKYCDNVLEPFVNLAKVTFLLHRLAFQFQPPARIFRYARGTRFDPTYMENAFPIDVNDSDQELVVGLLIVPGFQVGATIVKCTVYLVPSSMVVSPGSHHAN